MFAPVTRLLPLANWVGSIGRSHFKLVRIFTVLKYGLLRETMMFVGAWLGNLNVVQTGNSRSMQMSTECAPIKGKWSIQPFLLQRMIYLTADRVVMDVYMSFCLICRVCNAISVYESTCSRSKTCVYNNC